MKQPFNLKHPVHLLATGFASGLLKPAPGTWGSLAAWLIYFLALSRLPLNVFYAVTAVAIVLGVYLCGKAAKDCGTHDHSSIVWDEFAGLWLAFALISYYFAMAVPLLWQALAFVLFRLFDISKPFPIGLLDRRLKGGLGIMLDDVVAGVFAGLLSCLAMVIYLLYIVHDV